MNSVLFTILSLVVVLGVLVFIHEAGHFLAAKAAGIHVHRFSLGMGAPIRALTFTRGGTEYSISWLPLGGYVKMASREEAVSSSALEGGAALGPVPPDAYFESKPIWARMIVILAGVFMNAVFAWMVFAGLLYKNGESVTPVTTVGRVVSEELPPSAQRLLALEPGDSIVAVAGHQVSSWDEVRDLIQSAHGDSVTIDVVGKPPVVLPIHHDALDARIRASLAVQPYLPPVVGQVADSGPAARAGMQPGDTIVAVDAEPVAQWYELVTRVSARPEETLQLTVGRVGGRVDLTATTSRVEGDSISGGKPRGMLGIAVQNPTRWDPVTLGQALAGGLRETGTWSTQIVRTVRGMMFGRVSTREVGGPILIGQMAAQSAHAGLEPFLWFMAVISVNLAVLNLLPIPILDGGQFLFLLGEAVLRRPLSLKLRERLTAVGLVLVLLLMVLAFSNDIRRLLGV